MYTCGMPMHLEVEGRGFHHHANMFIYCSLDMFKATTAAGVMLHRPNIRILNATKKRHRVRDSQPSSSKSPTKKNTTPFRVFSHDVFIYTSRPSDTALETTWIPP